MTFGVTTKRRQMENPEMEKKGPSTEEFDALAKSVKDIAELAKKGQEESKEQVAAIVKEVLASHPGKTEQGTIELPGAGAKTVVTTEAKVLAKMPQELKDASDSIFMASQMLNVSPKSLNIYKSFRDDAKEYIKALDSTTSGGVDEWVPTGFSNTLEKLVRIDQRVSALFRGIPMPTNPFTPPIQIGKITTSKQAEQTGDTGQTKIAVSDGNSLSGSFTLSAVKHAARVLFSKEATEDSIVPILPFLLEEYATAFKEGRDDGLLNGDTAGTHQDSNVTAASDRRKMWLGLRATCIDQSYSTDMSTFNVTNLRAMRSPMGKYGISPMDLVWLVSPVGYFKLMGLTEVKTVDKYGDKATLLSGELAKFDGIPIIVSEYMQDDLNASGVYDGVTTSKSSIILVNRRGHVFGDRSGFGTQVLREVYAESGQDALIASERKAFRDLYPIASNHTVHLGYNIA